MKLKKIMFYICTFILIILAILIIVPIIFKDKIKEAVINTANQNLNAKVEIEDFSLSLFKNFPNATLSLNNTFILGVDSFANDTLLQAKNLSITINLKSLFGDNYEIQNVSIDNAQIEIRYNKEGALNWNIAKDTESTKDIESSSPSDSNFSLALQNIEIQNSNIHYLDASSDIDALLHNINAKVSGDFSANETTLIVSATSDELKFSMGKLTYLSKIGLKINTKIHADFENMKFSIDDSKIYLNELLTELAGTISLRSEKGYDLDLKVKAPNANFTQILSLIPVMYNDQLKTIQTTGDVSLNASIVGTYTNTDLPIIDLSLLIKNAMIKYPQLPKPIQDINLQININGKPSGLEQLKISIDKFGFSINNNFLVGSFAMIPLRQDQSIVAKINGKLNLASIKEVYPLPAGIDLSGDVNANLDLNTTMNAIHKEDYSKINADGSLAIADLIYQSKNLQKIKVNEVDLKFNPSNIDLNKLDMIIGKSDIRATGKLQNIIGFLLAKQTIKGNLKVQSNLLDIEELTTMSRPSSTKDNNDSINTVLNNVSIPTNIDFTASCDIKSILIDDISITNLLASATIKNGSFTLNNTTANLLGGQGKINGKYDSNTTSPTLEMNININQASFNQTFKNIKTIRKFAPIFSEISGTYSMNIDFNAKTKDFLNSMNANGILSSKDFTLEGNKALEGLGKILQTDKLNKVSTKDIVLPFVVKDGTLTTKPFKTTINDDIQLSLEGSTKLDQTIDYKGAISLPRNLSNGILSAIPLTIKGSFSDPKVNLDTKAATTDLISNLFGKKDKKAESDSTQISKEKDAAEELKQKALDRIKKLK